MNFAHKLVAAGHDIRNGIIASRQLTGRVCNRVFELEHGRVRERTTR